MNPTGQVKLTIGYSTEEARLFITVHACRFLLSALLTSHLSSWSTDHQKMLCVCFPTPHLPRRALAACSKDGADPYVSFILLPDKKATTKRRTATKKRDLNPEFNERQDKETIEMTEEKRGCSLTPPPPTSSLHRFDFDFSLEESYQRRLDLSVKNSVSFMSRERELIGKVCVIRDKLIYSCKKSLKVTKTPCS